ncbi:unnamed protein product [Pseudo-nitzschia multistriata]|uniref:Fe2OG dioxygenase domain-containing protein n=1 Tax=Pseudo-nitzschia multistriata TaxID=183589 RepID=A0A448Z9F9_9STRA|nr:unnamed protein product [Pseudo-nitzschia multistriata]
MTKMNKKTEATMNDKDDQSSSIGNNISIPTLDLGDPDAAQKLAAIGRNVGFFYLEGHGLSPDYIDSVFAASKALFDLPLEEKTKLSDHTMSRGYTAMQEETLDLANQTEGDTKEGYYIGRDVPVGDPRYDPAKLRGPNQWPESSLLPSFQPIMEDYHSRATAVAMRVVRLFALSLGLEETHFDADFEECVATLRLLHYSGRPSDPDKGIYACGAHSDYGMATLLLTDKNPGLQIYYQEEWIDVPPRPHSFVVNLGDLLEVWTNGIYKSTLHRVLTKAPCDEDRYSIPFFFDPVYETVVECLETCTDASNPPKYQPTTAGRYLISKYEGTHADFQQDTTPGQP